jgi:hypothetical protein
MTGSDTIPLKSVGVERWNKSSVIFTNGMFAGGGMWMNAKTVLLIEMSFNGIVDKVEYLLDMLSNAILFKGIGIGQ